MRTPIHATGKVVDDLHSLYFLNQTTKSIQTVASFFIDISHFHS